MSIKLKIVPWLELLVDALWKNKSQMMKDRSFDYPDYGGLPKDVSDQLTSEHVDFLQENVIDILGSYRTKKQFAKRLVEDLTSGFVSVK
jgi:hypothetical protein